MKMDNNDLQARTKRRMRIMLISMLILFGGIFMYKAFVAWMIKRYLANMSDIVNVSAMRVDYSNWQPQLTAAASLRAIHGVNVTTELAGMVQTVYFQPGASVKAGDVLVQLNADNDIAQLHALQASAELAQITYNRDKAQYAVQAISKQTVDNDAANVKNLTAQVAQQAAIVAKKTIRAPFDGRLGINNINLGQFINPGDSIVMLQTLDPIYVDFNIPQQSLHELRIGQEVTLVSDAAPQKTFTGKITTINPAVDTTTRNVQVEATFANPQHELIPGTFSTVKVNIGALQSYLTLPQTAISFNSYGQIVYIIHQTGKDKMGKPILMAQQTFVATGDTRGDQITILKGVKSGDWVVTSGQLKLKNNTQVVINNSIVPTNNPASVLSNNHAS